MEKIEAIEKIINGDSTDRFEYLNHPNHPLFNHLQSLQRTLKGYVTARTTGKFSSFVCFCLTVIDFPSATQRNCN